jgi:hypothetical protein
MTLFPNGGYSRVTHYDDIVPHIPMSSMGFNHAGNEDWYYNEGADLSWTECENFISSGENASCSNKY